MLSAPSSSQYVSASAAKDAILAIAYCDFIDAPNSPYTQDHYDHLTRPWRTIFEDWDTNDADIPASWDRRRHVSPVDFEMQYSSQAAEIQLAA